MVVRSRSELDGRGELYRLGEFPYRCATCELIFESVSDLADPDSHSWEVAR